MKLKDERLYELSQTHNVARFISFAPDKRFRFTTERQRVIDNFELGPEVYSTMMFDANLNAFISPAYNSTMTSFNIRTFGEDNEQGHPFLYGLTDLKDIVNKVEALCEKGYYCIVHETIDIHDGGLAGCTYQNGILNISPNTTPRGIEKATNIASIHKWDPIIGHLENKLNFKLKDLNFDEGKRYEFSVHPDKVGHKQEHVLLWEVSDNYDYEELDEHQIWPSDLSRYIGDKLYGLLVAKHLGQDIPQTMIGKVGPGKFIEYDNIYPTMNMVSEDRYVLRPCPSEQIPGKLDSIILQSNDLTTYSFDRNGEEHLIIESKYITSEWVDELNRTNTEVVLLQPYIKATYSGGFIADMDKNICTVEGVKGQGSSFMLNEQEPEELPFEVIGTVMSTAGYLCRELNSPVRGEWIISEETGDLVIVQLHMVAPKEVVDPEEGTESDYIHISGSATVDFENINMFFWDPSEGLDELRNTVRLLKDMENTTGLLIKKRIGLTTHAADIVRKAGVIAYMYKWK